VTTSNCSNNFGPYQFPEKLVPLRITRMFDGGELPVYGDGSNRRDWLFVADHCAGVAAVLERGRAGETYVFGGRGECSNLELVHRLVEAVDSRLIANAALRERFPDSPEPRLALLNQPREGRTRARMAPTAHPTRCDRSDGGLVRRKRALVAGAGGESLTHLPLR